MRPVRWILLVVLASGVVAFAAIVVDLARPDCDSFQADAAAFRGEDRDTPAPGLRKRAETLVRCGHLVGRTPSEVTTAVGSPDRRGSDDNPRPHRELAYTLGIDEGSASNSELYLHMELDRGRVVYATVDGTGSKVVDGEPVGGGPVDVE